MFIRNTVMAAMALALVACSASTDVARGPLVAPAGTAEAVFAGGCFWCVEHDFEELPGVIDAVSGYTGGTLENPRYEDVVTERTGHFEAVRVIYDPALVSYNQLLDYFWRHVDPTDAGGQFCDRGPSYRTGIFVTPEQRSEAEASLAALQASGVLPAPVVTEILPLGAFWQGEDYHQEYSDKNPVRYSYYRSGCGRDARVRAVWRGDRG
ncbi:MAG: peptide-methionine (S)-S-oxide reductase MsrA [Caulobacterales bacterium]